jgi:hypothetical protein
LSDCRKDTRTLQEEIKRIERRFYDRYEFLRS